MIGPGTGVAPFIGFLQQKKHLLNILEDENNNNNKHTWTDDCYLFFGCRQRSLDYLYYDELQQYFDDNLVKLITAFSRETDQVVYVQDKLLEHEKEIYPLLVNQHAKIYICGDAKGMAKGVMNSLHEILIKNEQITKKEALTKTASWMKEKRIVMDIWS
eukprot:TRINITY_DN5360_c0_g1_i1.p1 TRINITY_DN5360_c0_g1~~TRINITY_DN5360_c0_g1_i1.p1  ORF type:complete len:159 (+),score=43.16 TRINITY_DN5360_c0_g1_i1:745-1221(+)